MMSMEDDGDGVCDDHGDEDDYDDADDVFSCLLAA